ncbi:MAG: branched-chain amino acid transport system II carrier protein [Psychrilyobacter sp.]|nr:branched-chain amino acid transport system II carrier protein [Psychrilyobacter sp.]
MKNKKEYIILGMALFAMFFGAGNLIFPPALGAKVGTEWGLSVLGFFITGIGLPMLGVIAFNKVGSLEKFGDKVSTKFSLIYTSILVLALGPLLAIPRTGATTFEMGVQPNFGHISPIISSIIYFSLTLLMVLNPSKIIENIGKILTPIILLMLGVIIIKGIISPMGLPIATSLDKGAFGTGFLEGYQTMDALGSILIGSVVLSALKASGYNNANERKNLVFKAAIVAGLGLALVYGGLLYLGATASSLSAGLGKTQLTMFLATSILGNMGNSVLGLAISAACLTTSSALVMIVGEHFSKVTKFSYKQIVTVTCIFSGVMAIQGVDMIIQLAVPILMILYPMTIILIILNFFQVENKLIFRVSIGVAFFCSLIDLGAEIFHIDLFKEIFNFIPLASSGFIWLIPTISLTIVAYLTARTEKESIFIG